MTSMIDLEAVCARSENVVAREIEEEILIVPLAAGIGDADDDLYTLNETGQAIWQALDGQRSLKDVAALLAARFNAPGPEIERDVLGFAGELVRRGILVTRP
jgi:hypothetical protein